MNVKGVWIMVSAYCPDCDGLISINPHAVPGQKVTCPHCDADFEVINLEPLELDWVYDWSWGYKEDGLVQTSSLA
jgi:uncharacterized paraquat-inducible protein A